MEYIELVFHYMVYVMNNVAASSNLQELPLILLSLEGIVETRTAATSILSVSSHLLHGRLWCRTVG